MAASGTVMEELDLAALGATGFVEHFYERYDKFRAEVSKFYHESSFLLWNGTFKGGRAEIEAFLQRLPTSHHTITTVDCHSLYSSGSMTLLTSVAGTVQFGDNPARPFYQVFLLSPEGQFYYIKTDNMRFI